MIERVAAGDERVTRLGAHFHAVAVPATAMEPVLVVDREQERRDVLAEAQRLGHAQGMQQAAEQIHAAVDAAERECRARHAEALAALEAERTRLVGWGEQLVSQQQAMEHALLQTAAQLAYAALMRVLAEMPAEERVRQVCQQALSEQKQRPLVVRLAPADAPLADALVGAGIRVEGDARLLPGQCRIESPLGIDDAGLDVRLDALRQAFLDGLAHTGARA